VAGSFLSERLFNEAAREVSTQASAEEQPAQPSSGGDEAQGTAAATEQPTAAQP